ncbi:MAG: sugar transferase [Bacteroidia bacterium]
MDNNITNAGPYNLLLDLKASRPMVGQGSASELNPAIESGGNNVSIPEEERPLRRLVYIGQVSPEMRSSLAELRYDIWEFSSCEEAYVYFKDQGKRKTQLTGAWTPFGIICDWEMPKGGILAWYDKLTKLSGFHKIPVIALAKNPGKSLKAEAVRIGIDDVQSYKVSSNSLDAVLRFWATYKAMLPKNPTPLSIQPVRIGFMKRALDIALAGGLLLLLSPLILIVALIIKIDSPGPIFYISKRVGAGYKVFNFYKFRSMRTGADKELEDLIHLNQYSNGELVSDGASPTIEDVCLDCISEGKACESQMELNGATVCKKMHDQSSKPTFFKLENDPRVTPFGRFIRKSSIDELPQLLNVLKGDMSIVGNRPLPTYEAEVLTSDEHIRRFMGPAGITGLWQVTKRGTSDMSEEERIQLDIEYAERHNFWYDLGIMFKTIPALVQKEAV